MKFSIETVLRVFDDENGCYFEIYRDDNNVAISYCDGGVTSKAERITAMPPEMAMLLVQAIAKISNEIMDDKEDKDGKTVILKVLNEG